MVGVTRGPHAGEFYTKVTIRKEIKTDDTFDQKEGRVV